MQSSAPRASDDRRSACDAPDLLAEQAALLASATPEPEAFKAYLERLKTYLTTPDDDPTPP